MTEQDSGADTGAGARADLAALQDTFDRNLWQQEAVGHLQATHLLKLAFVARAAAVIEQLGSAEGSEAMERLIADFNRLMAAFQRLPAQGAFAAPGNAGVASGAASPSNPPTLSTADDNRSFAMPLNQEIVDAVTVGNLKTVGEQPAMLSNLAYANLVANTNLAQQNAVANQQAMNELGIAVLGKAVNTVSNLGPLEARSAVDVLTNNELAQTIADLKATVQAFKASDKP